MLKTPPQGSVSDIATYRQLPCLPTIPPELSHSIKKLGIA